MRKIKILFVCHGNICRSPMSEFILKDMVTKQGIADDFHIASAATSNEEIGNPPHYGTRNKLAEEKIPLVPHRARQMTRDDYLYYDYLIGMDSANIRNMTRIAGGEDTNQKIFMLLEFADCYREVADPWYTGDFDATYRDVVDGCEGFLHYLTQEGLIGE